MKQHLFKSLGKQFKHVNKKTAANPQFKHIAAWSIRTTKLQTVISRACHCHHLGLQHFILLEQNQNCSKSSSIKFVRRLFIDHALSAVLRSFLLIRMLMAIQLPFLRLPVPRLTSLNPTCRMTDYD